MSNFVKKLKIWRKSGRIERRFGELQKFCVKKRQERVPPEGIENRYGGRRMSRRQFVKRRFERR